MRNVVYRIIFPNGKSYIGIASDFSDRRAEHLSRAKCAPSQLVHFAIKKYGADAIKWEILKSGLESWDEMCEFEKQFIKQFNTRSFGYNLTDGGEGSLGTTAFHGRTHSEQTKRVMSERRKGIKFSEETLEKMSIAQRARIRSPLSQITRDKIAVSNGSRKFAVYQAVLISGRAGTSSGKYVKGEHIGEWKSVRSCARDLGVHHNYIYRCLKALRPTAGGFIFEYLNGSL